MPALLIFGGSGFLGSRLIAVGRSHGFDVSATHLTSPPVTLPEDGALGAGPDGVRWVRCDIADQRAVDELVEQVQPDVVMNAAYVQNGPAAGVVCGDAAGWIAEAAVRVSARLVHVSTDLVFDGTLGRRYIEDDVPSPLSAYGEAKLRGEQLVAAAAPTAVIARTSLIFGAPTAPQEMLAQRALGASDMAFFTNEWRSPIHVDDLAHALIELAKGAFAGVLHVAGNERLDRLSFAQRLVTHAGHSPDPLVGRPQDPALGPRPTDVSLDVSRAIDLGLSLPGASARLAR